jgi:type IV secretion system protein VirD4
MRFRPFAALCRCLLVLAVGIAFFTAFALAVRFPSITAIVFGCLAYRKLSRWRGSGTAYGTARPSGFGSLWHRGLLDDDGLIMGRAGYTLPPSKLEGVTALFSPLPSALACRLFLAAWLGSRQCREQIIRINDYVHVGTFAPSGAGKNVAAVVPNLRSHRGGCCVTDPKGENFFLTADHRRRKFKHKIIHIDPFSVLESYGIREKGHALNPLDFLPPANAPDFLDACRDLANSLVMRQGTEHEPHWNDSAERVLLSFIAYVAACEADPAKRNLLTVRALISSRAAYEEAGEEMRQTTGFGGVVRRLGDSLTWLADKELNSVLSHVQRHTAWVDSPAVSACLSRSTFDPRELRGRATLYLILPPERIVTMAPLMRMWLSTTLRTLTRGQASERHPVLFILDEVAQLGRMQILEDALTLMRGYGIRLWLIFQSINQLQKCYGEHAATVLDNLATQQYFGTNTYESAEALSRRIGEYTILLASQNTTLGHSHPTSQTGREPSPSSRNTSTAITLSEIGRRWQRPEEILTWPDDMGVVFHKNVPFIFIKLLKYFDAPEFRWGGTGKSRGLGLAGGVMALALLLASVVFAAKATPFLAPATRPLPSAAAPSLRLVPPPGSSLKRPLPAYGGTARHPAYGPVPRQPNQRTRLQRSRGGFLMPPPRLVPEGPALRRRP